MRRLSIWAAVVAPLFLASFVAIGCGTGADDVPTKPGKSADKGTGKGEGGKAGPTVLESKGWGTIKGKVTVDGTPDLAARNAAIKAQMDKQGDKGHCLSDMAPAKDKEQQAWRIDKDGGVANVFVWLKPPARKFFTIHPDLQKPKDVVMDQPYCAFEPHCVVLFPKMIDPANPRKLVATGQKFLVKNSAPINHNTNWKGGTDNPGDNKVIPKREGDKINSIEVPSLEPSNQEVIFKCDIHGWMSAYARVFDHPYAAVTGQDGGFELKNVPAGAEVSIVVWHEEAKYVTPEAGEPITVEDGKTLEKNFKVKAK